MYHSAKNHIDFGVCLSKMFMKKHLKNSRILDFLDRYINHHRLGMILSDHYSIERMLE